MEESLIKLDPDGKKKDINIPGLCDIDPRGYNACGGLFLIGCWLGCCLIPLIQKKKLNS